MVSNRFFFKTARSFLIPFGRCIVHSKMHHLPKFQKNCTTRFGFMKHRSITELRDLIAESRSSTTETMTCSDLAARISQNLTDTFYFKFIYVIIGSQINNRNRQKKIPGLRFEKEAEQQRSNHFRDLIAESRSSTTETMNGKSNLSLNGNLKNQCFQMDFSSKLPVRF